MYESLTESIINNDCNCTTVQTDNYRMLRIFLSVCKCVSENNDAFRKWSEKIIEVLQTKVNSRSTNLFFSFSLEIRNVPHKRILNLDK